MTSPIFLGGENLKNKNVLKPPPLVSIWPAPPLPSVLPQRVWHDATKLTCQTQHTSGVHAQIRAGWRFPWIILAHDENLTTVDGRNPAPVEVGSLSQYLQGFIHPRWWQISSINSSYNHGNPQPSFSVVISPIFLGHNTCIFHVLLGSKGRVLG